MNERHIDALAAAVARHVAGRSPAPAAASHRNGRDGGAPARHETPDIGWRMPMGGAPPAAAPAPPPAGSPGRAAADERADREGAPMRIADYVDHTLLKAEATAVQIDTLCEEARVHRFATVCVNGWWVPRCARLLRDAPVGVATVVGFPLGAMASAAKAFETKTAVEDGADEIDMVAPIGAVLDERWDDVEDDIAAVVEAAAGRAVKVILETGALHPLAIVKGAAIAKAAGAAFVKTSTGFHPSGGATEEAVALLRLAVGDALGVKASGGIRDCATALRMVAAGATRIGTSSGVQFVECLGRGGATLTALVADPGGHETACITGACVS